MLFSFLNPLLFGPNICLGQRPVLRRKKLENRPIDALDYLYSCITVISALLFAVIFALLYYW